MVSVRPVPMPGALVEGWSAWVIDVLLAKHLNRYLAAMSSDQRAEVLAMRAAVHGAAKLWQERGGSVNGTGSGPAEPIEAVSEAPLQVVSVADAAPVLGLSDRRVRKLAERWEAQGLARKVAGSWSIDREALEMHKANRGSAA